MRQPPETDADRAAREAQRRKNAETMNGLLHGQLARRQPQRGLHLNDPQFSKKINAGIRQAMGRTPAAERKRDGEQ
jgi:hypothetical protein